MLMSSRKDDQERQPLLEADSAKGSKAEPSKGAASAAPNLPSGDSSADDLSQRLAALKATVPTVTPEIDAQDVDELDARLARLVQQPHSTTTTGTPPVPAYSPEDQETVRRFEEFKRKNAEEEQRKRQSLVTSPSLASSSLFVPPSAARPYTLPIADPVPSVLVPHAAVVPPKVQLQLAQANIQAEAMKQIFNLFNGELSDRLLHMIPDERDPLTQHYVFPKVLGTLIIDGSKGRISISDDNDELIARMLSAAKIAADLAINPVFEINGDEKMKAKLVKLFQAHGLRIGSPPAKEANSALPSPNA
jgi:hypothetical protein